MENQLKTIQSVTHNGRIKYNGDHFVYIDIYVDKYNIITSILHRLENSHKKTFQVQQRDSYGILLVSIVGSLRDREVARSASDRQGSNFEFCVWRTVSSQSSHHPQEVLLAQFSLYVHKGGLKPDSFHLRHIIHTTQTIWR